MGGFLGSAEWPEDFCGIVSLFPLPNLVLFPHIVQPLHVFEPRYCDMLADSLARDRLIAMALLEPGWELHYVNRPSVAPVVCIGKVIAHTPTEDRRHNILLAGLKRGRIRRELDNNRAFRQAEVDVLSDVYPESGNAQRADLQQSLLEAFTQLVPAGLAIEESFQHLAGQQVPLGMLTDIITFTINFPLLIKQQVLAEPNVDVRCRILMRCLQQILEVRKQSVESSISLNFPPRFSSN